MNDSRCTLVPSFIIDWLAHESSPERRETHAPTQQGTFHSFTQESAAGKLLSATWPSLLATMFLLPEGDLELCKVFRSAPKSRQEFVLDSAPWELVVRKNETQLQLIRLGSSRLGRLGGKNA